MVTGTAALQTVLNYNSGWVRVSGLTTVDISIARCRVSQSSNDHEIVEEPNERCINIFIS